METIAAIGLDLAKNVFQVCGVDINGEAQFNKKLRRSEVLRFFQSIPPCEVGMEACATANYWAREIGAAGHSIRIIPAQYVKPFVMRDKNDANDARAICEAMKWPQVRTVPAKTLEQQGLLISTRVRQLLVRQRAQLTNAIKYHFAELGIVVPAGRWNAKQLIEFVQQGADARVPARALCALRSLIAQMEDASIRIAEMDKEILQAAKEDEETQRLMTIPGVGITTATTFKAFVTDIGRFETSRHFASWLGLTPRSYSSGGKQQLGGISKRGNPTLRSLLVVGASSVMRNIKRTSNAPPWLQSLVGRKPFRVASVALANKMARVIWAILTRGGTFRQPEALLQLQAS